MPDKKNEKNRTLFYRRVVWHDDSGKTMENLLISAHLKLETTEDRTFNYNDYEIQGMKIEHKDAIGLFCHVSSYIPGQKRSVVPHPSPAKETVPLTQDPPHKHNFMEGDIFFLINGNHIVLCPSGVRETIASAYITHTLQSVMNETTPRFSLEPIADINKVNLLNQEGVKRIELNSSLYDASLEYMKRKNDEHKTKERKTITKKLLAAAVKELQSIFASDSELHEIGKKENLNVRIELSFDSRKKDGDIGRKRIENVAHQLIKDERDDCFAIITGSGKRLTYDEVRLHEKVIIPAHGNSISRSETWASLDRYLRDLKLKGLIEQ